MSDGAHSDDDQNPVPDPVPVHVGSTAGKMLVSVPALSDDNFDRTVVLMVEHDDNGALGLVLNRPSGTEVAEHLPDLVGSVVSPPLFFVGGPVSIGGLMALGRRSLSSDVDGAMEVVGPVVLVDPQALVNGEVRGVEALRLFTGYSGWGPGQLESELELGVWYVVDSMADDVLCLEPGLLWRNVLRRQGGKLASQSFYPEDPSLN